MDATSARDGKLGFKNYLFVLSCSHSILIPSSSHSYSNTQFSSEKKKSHLTNSVARTLKEVHVLFQFKCRVKQPLICQFRSQSMHRNLLK